MHIFIIGGLCRLLWTVKGTPYKRASLGTRFGRLADHSTTSALLIQAHSSSTAHLHFKKPASINPTTLSNADVVVNHADNDNRRLTESRDSRKFPCLPARGYVLGLASLPVDVPRGYDDANPTPCEHLIDSFRNITYL